MATSFRGTPAEQINRTMKILLPETSGCTYADFPMTGTKWLNGKDKAPEGGYCYIRTEDKMPIDQGFKTGYVWGSGQFGYGYYHLLTKSAYLTLYNRIVNRKVFTGASSGGCCGCFGAPEANTIPTTLPTIPAGDLDNLRLLFHARSVATKPNDAQALEDQLGESKVTSNAHFMYNESIQTGTMLANSVNTMSRN